MKYLVVLGIFFFLLLSCDKKPRIILRSERHLIDSAYLDLVDSARVYVDSICEAMERGEYEYILDSIIEQRVMEIQKLQEK
jgi:hypothetical protein